MADIALYRKYRPENFKEVLGQEHVVTGLERALASGKIAHAYLFAGPRGTGKTSIARIVARTIGCTDKDCYEMDAASSRGIDDIRELRESVRTFPFESPYKVYIIDEVHMLTKEAFNALLKTLEEPPAHAVFILATTELHKLPETIISRCQTYHFKKPTQAILKKMIAKVAEEEGVKLESASADLIALLGEGSFRDAQGVLQKVLGSAEGKKIPHAHVEMITGAPSSELVNDFVQAVAEKDASVGIGAARKAASAGIDMKLYVHLILQKLRAALLLRFAPDMKEAILEELTAEDFAFVERLAKDKTAALNSAVLSELITAYQSVGKFVIPELPLELALIRIAGEKEEK
ncbi:MAG: DNA polymerase III subunit gamma/tau [Candidatus Lloydbacteria bacterium]|nr:DNA polymerase III subunit gamma/tau [Candidatus Lloydbacteria bacterium]